MASHVTGVVGRVRATITRLAIGGAPGRSHAKSSDQSVNRFAHGYEGIERRAMSRATASKVESWKVKMKCLASGNGVGADFGRTASIVRSCSSHDDSSTSWRAELQPASPEWVSVQSLVARFAAPYRYAADQLCSLNLVFAAHVSIGCAECNERSILRSEQHRKRSTRRPLETRDVEAKGAFHSRTVLPGIGLPAAPAVARQRHGTTLS